MYFYLNISVIRTKQIHKALNISFIVVYITLKKLEQPFFLLSCCH